MWTGTGLDGAQTCARTQGSRGTRSLGRDLQCGLFMEHIVAVPRYRRLAATSIAKFPRWR
jgi:hypothetical protein